MTASVLTHELSRTSDVPVFQKCVNTCTSGESSVVFCDIQLGAISGEAHLERIERTDQELDTEHFV